MLLLMRRTGREEIDTSPNPSAGESIRERDPRATIHPDTWNVPTTTLTEEQKTRRYLRLIWVSPIVMTLLGIFFLFLSVEKPWLPWAGFGLAIVGVIGAVVETRKVRAAARATKEPDGAAGRAEAPVR